VLLVLLLLLLLLLLAKGLTDDAYYDWYHKMDVVATRMQLR
jgi:hypothetical protein